MVALEEMAEMIITEEEVEVVEMVRYLVMLLLLLRQCLKQLLAVKVVGIP